MVFSVGSQLPITLDEPPSDEDEEDSTDEETESLRRRPPTECQGKKILVVDDIDLCRAVARHHLEYKLHHEVFTAASGPEGSYRTDLEW
jgi:hypoxanthine phosphoribosyltransferase